MNRVNHMGIVVFAAFGAFLLQAVGGVVADKAAASFKYPVTVVKDGRENIEWSTAYSYHVTDGRSSLPRVLLIGDSITAGYQGAVAKKLEGKVNVTYWASSYGVTAPMYWKLAETYLTDLRYDAVHFCPGTHSYHATDAEIEDGARRLIALIREKQPQAKLIWCSKTPVTNEVTNAKSLSINRITGRVAKDMGVEWRDDLYRLMKPYDHATYWRDPFHFKPAGIDLQAEQVAQSVLVALGLSPSRPQEKISVFAKFIRQTAKERGISLSAAADLLYGLGVRGYDCGPDEEDLDELAATKLKAVNFYYFPDWFGTDVHDWALGYTDRTNPTECIAKAKRYGIPRIMVVPPNFTGGKENETEFKVIVGKMRAFVAEAKAAGLVVTVETFGGTKNCCSHVKYLKRLLAEIPDLKFALDSGNLYYAGRGEDILEMMEYAKGRIAHVHLKDQTAEDGRRYVTLGLGAVPNEKIVKAMAAAHYDGWYTLENPVGDTYSDTVRQTALLKAWLLEARGVPVK